MLATVADEATTERSTGTATVPEGSRVAGTAVAFAAGTIGNTPPPTAPAQKGGHASAAPRRGIIAPDEATLTMGGLRTSSVAYAQLPGPPLHTASGGGAIVDSHSPSADTTVPLQRTAPTNTSVPSANERPRDRKTSGVESKRVRENGLVEESGCGRSTPPQTFCTAASTTAGSETAEERMAESDEPLDSAESRLAAPPLSLASRAAMSAEVELKRPGPRPLTDRENPFAATTITSSNVGHSVPTTETLKDALPIAESSAPVRLQTTDVSKLGVPNRGTRRTVMGMATPLRGAGSAAKQVTAPVDAG